MKKVIIFLFVGVLSIGATFAQRSVFVDTDYILNKIPAYKEAQEQLDKTTLEWQTEIQKQIDNLDKMYKQYQVDKVLLSNDMRQKREQEILEKEKEVKEYKNINLINEFGFNGTEKMLLEIIENL